MEVNMVVVAAADVLMERWVLVVMEEEMVLQVHQAVQELQELPIQEVVVAADGVQALAVQEVQVFSFADSHEYRMRP